MECIAPALRMPGVGRAPNVAWRLPCSNSSRALVFVVRPLASPLGRQKPGCPVARDQRIEKT